MVPDKCRDAAESKCAGVVENDAAEEWQKNVFAHRSAVEPGITRHGSHHGMGHTVNKAEGHAADGQSPDCVIVFVNGF